MTVEEYFATPEVVTPQELVFGQFRAADSPSPIHQHAVGQLFLALHRHLQRHPVGRVWLAPLDVVLDQARGLVLQPDLLVIADGRDGIVRDRVYGPPDLCIEVLSPAPRIGQVEERVQLFGDHGVRECWLVHQIDRWVQVITFAEGRQRRRLFAENQPLVSGVVPEFGDTLASMLGY